MIKRVSDIHFRTNETERTALKRIAAQEGRCPSEMLRELVRAEAKRRGLWPEPSKEPDPLEDVVIVDDGHNPMEIIMSESIAIQREEMRKYYEAGNNVTENPT